MNRKRRIKIFLIEVKRLSVLLWIVFPIGLNAQILTSEVKVEQTNNLTTINGKTIIKGTVSSNGLKIGGKYILEEGRNFSGIDLDLVNADYNAIRGYRDQTNIGTIHFFDTSWRSGSPSFSAGSLNLWGTTAVTVGPWNDPTAYFRSSDGYVGIGTVSPTDRFTVEGISSLKGIKIPNKVALNSGHHESAIELGIEAGDWNAIRGYQGDINIGTIHFFDNAWGGGAPINSAGSINLKGNKAVTIGAWNNLDVYVRHDDGFVGIGTVTPTERLHVNGNIRATAPVWSDFVFEESYKLPKLEEVEDFIVSNGHLKEIPSAKEVEESGINLGEMDAKLLQKIEELTLYIIEQHKQTKSQQELLELQAEQIKKMATELAGLRKELNTLSKR